MNSKDASPTALPQPQPPPLSVPLRTLDEHMSSDQSFSSAYARAVGALAACEGRLTLAQFAAVTEIAGEGKASAVFTALVLNAIESAVDIDWALNALGRHCGTVEPAARSHALEMSLPLLALHGADARALAQRLAKALGVRLAPEHLSCLPLAEERGLLASLGEQARRLVRGPTVADAVADFGRQTGQDTLVEQARNFQSGHLDHDQLQQVVQAATHAISHAILAYQEQACTLSQQEASAAGLVTAAGALQQQVQQRLTLIDARIAHERQLLGEDIDDAVHDAGNAIELAIGDRLDSDQWQDAEVWASIGRNQYGKEMARRLDRVVRRREQALHLLQEELRLFQSAMQLSQSSVFQRQHHTALARLMPRLRLGTRLVNGVDAAANVTLVGGAVAAAGGGTAAYLFGAAVVLPVLAPVAPFVGGAVLLAGAFKWFADGGKRKRSEIRDKRAAFEDELRQQLRAAERTYNAQLDLVAQGFQVSAQQMLIPILLEAEAAGRVHGMRQRVADRVILQAQAAIGRLDAALDGRQRG